jgi:hypothetical protein
MALLIDRTKTVTLPWLLIIHNKATLRWQG